MDGEQRIGERGSALLVYSWREFRQLAQARRRGWRWDGILPATGIVLMTGEAFAGKSTLIAALAAAMSCDEGEKGSLAGRRVRRGKMLYAWLEHSAEDVETTFAKAEAGAGAQGLSLKIVAGLDLDNDAHVAQLERIATRSKARVIVIDPFRRSTRADENRAEEISAYANILRRLAGDDRLVIVIHHDQKNGHRPRGSTDFMAMTDTWISVALRDDRLRLKVTHHARSKVDLTVRVRHEEGRVTLEEASAAVGSGSGDNGSIEGAVLDVITNEPGMGMRRLRQAVTAKVKTSHDRIDEAVKSLSKSSVIENRGSAGKHQWFRGSKK